MSLQRAFPLPARRHRPGLDARPEGGPVAAAAAAARQTFDPARWSASAAYLYGFDLLAEGFFWEAHEVWEPAWMRCLPNSRERAVVQGLIQCANAGLKSAMGWHRAAGRLLRLATTLFQEASGTDAVMGVDATRAAAVLQTLQTAEPGADAARAIAACRALRPMCSIIQ